jgi:hypothetical protein
MKWAGFSPVIGNCLRLKIFNHFFLENTSGEKVIEEKEKINHFSL